MSAIYFVVNGERDIIYIGRAVHLAHRWMHHHRIDYLSALTRVTIAWLAVDDITLLNAIEKACIVHFSPLINGKCLTPRATRTIVKKVLITFEEDRAIVAQLDRIAAEQSTSRSTIIRQLIRKAIALTTKSKERPQ